MYKLFERLILARLQSLLKASLPREQAGFRKYRNCYDHTLALATHIENGFQRQEVWRILPRPLISVRHRM